MSFITADDVPGLFLRSGSRNVSHRVRSAYSVYAVRRIGHRVIHAADNGRTSCSGNLLGVLHNRRRSSMTSCDPLLISMPLAYDATPHEALPWQGMLAEPFRSPLLT